MPPRRRPNFQQLPLTQQMEIVRNLMPFPALTVMVFLRCDMGYRLLNPSWLLGVTVFQIVAAILLRPANAGNLPSPWIVFACASFALGIFERFRRKQDFENRIRKHSFYLGTSRLEFSWLPDFVRRSRRVSRFGDPLLCFIIGTVLLFFSPALGFWLAFAGFSLRVFEDEVHKKELNQALDIVDGLIISEDQSEFVNQFDEGPGPIQALTPDPGVSAGLHDDVREQLKRRGTARVPPPAGDGTATPAAEIVSTLRSQPSSVIPAGLGEDIQQRIKNREPKPNG